MRTIDQTGVGPEQAESPLVSLMIGDDTYTTETYTEPELIEKLAAAPSGLEVRATIDGSEWRAIPTDRYESGTMIYTFKPTTQDVGAAILRRIAPIYRGPFLNQFTGPEAEIEENDGLVRVTYNPPNDSSTWAERSRNEPFTFAEERRQLFVHNTGQYGHEVDLKLLVVSGYVFSHAGSR